MAFNRELSELRVAIEHCIGMLKSRWQSLKDLRLLLKDRRSLVRLNGWLSACCVLHNFLLERDEMSAFRYHISTQAERDAEEALLGDPAIQLLISEDNLEHTRMCVFQNFCDSL